MSLETIFKLLWLSATLIFVINNVYLVNFIYLILAFYASLGKSQALKAIFLTWFISILNPSLSQIEEVQRLDRYLVLFVAFFSVFIRTNLKIDKISFYTILFTLFVSFHSFIFSYLPSVSFLKIFIWMIVVLTLIEGWSNLTLNEFKHLDKWLLNFYIIIIYFSLALHFFSNIGYVVNASLFQGIFNHPQTFGLTISVLTIIFLRKLIYQSEYRVFYFITISICVYLLFISGSRVSFISTLLIFIIHLLYYLFFKFPFNKNNNRNFISFIIIVFLIFSVFLIPIDLNNFLIKSRYLENVNFINMYLDSRSILINPMLENIKDYFMFGIGFGLDSDLSNQNIKYDPLFNLPISLPVEKGVMPLMILEGIGIFGLIIFLFWFFLLFKRIGKSDFVAKLLILNILLLNMVEATFFSMGGSGLFHLLVIFSLFKKTNDYSNIKGSKKFSE